MGARGLASELIQLIWEEGIRDIAFFDDIDPNAPDRLFGQFQVIRSITELGKWFSSHGPEFLPGVGSCAGRQRVVEKAIQAGGILTSMRSGRASIGCFGTSIGPGTCIFPQAIVTTNVTIGTCVLINKAATISHDATIGAYSTIHPGARVLGGVHIGELSEIGTNSVILPRIRIGERCVVGAGSVVRKDVPDDATVVGVPAGRIR